MPLYQSDFLGKVVEDMVRNATREIVMSRDEFKELLHNADHHKLGELIMLLDVEIHNYDYPTLKYWEKNVIKSYSYVYNTNGKFATAKIAHNVRICLLSQYTLVMIAMTRDHIHKSINQ